MILLICGIYEIKQMNIGEGKEKGSKLKTEREANRKRLLNIENRGLLEGLWEGGWAKWSKGIKESTPEIIVALYAS